jgi:N-methylhydantoinase A
MDTPVLHVESMLPSQIVTGPAIIESSFTSVVVDPGAMAERMASGSLLIRLNPTELS